MTTIPAVLEVAVPDTASRTNGGERGTSEESPTRASEITSLCRVRRNSRRVSIGSAMASSLGGKKSRSRKEPVP